jgi:hypothetical protein
MSLPTQKYLHKMLSYDRETGVFRWISEPKVIGSCLGEVAGTNRRGYVVISVKCEDGKRRQIGAHRLAWIYENGDLPQGAEIDHKNCDSSKNEIDNLRLATSSQQKMNKRVQSNNRCGLKGAYYHACHKGKKWRSQIKTKAGLIFLGYFHTAQEAHQAYAAAARRYFGEFARAA